MPLSSDLVGTTGAPFSSTIDARWAMNFAAGIDDVTPILYDTTSDALPIHPMVLGYPEWEATKRGRELASLTPEEHRRGVHVRHDIRLHQPLRAGLELTTTPEIVGAYRHRAGAYLALQHQTHTLAGEPVATTFYGSIHRGTDTVGDDVIPALEERPSTPPDAATGPALELSIPANACHVYSECARIYNPFHTDLRVAHEVGLDGLILHGTATLARSVAAITGVLYGGDPSTITRIAGDFKGMVVVPTSLTLTYSRFVGADGADTVTFEVLNTAGDRAISDGLIEYGG
ncbi:MaoC dehydratase-like protein [Antricoccus suffuscus]|uniref:MaoC dehydratase-like protein n=1 Tax=Antricoccus suffuscus TaxID=1629062 RepID=A0A2T1A5W3_9ACTN|nr:MaoC/PaaZ C-terminal domain-containing protein [Antricoccus suffuscus]PRZ43980.1 MaoC dehydratase-like protein [Antricoccus suffuscus]